MYLAAAFLFLYSLILTLSPAVREHSWAVEYRWQHWIGFIVWLVLFAFAHRQVTLLIPDRDPYLLPLAAMLSGWGNLMIWRLDVMFGLRQTVWLTICVLVLLAGLRMSRPLYYLQRYKYLWLIGGLLLTGLTFIFGTYPDGQGPHLWLGCCGMYLQPSEPLKLLLIVYLSAYLADSLPLSFNFMQLVAPTLVLTGTALAILVAQRDLGTASLFLMLYFIVIYLASGKRRVLAIAAGITVTAAITGYILFDVIRLRIEAWLNPWLDPTGRSYQIVQSILAVASGGLFGSGPGIGNPGVVPVAHSDFIFSSIAEETGLIGSAALMIIVALLVCRGLLVALRASSHYQRYLAAGISIYLTLQSLLIVGGNLRVLPLTGVTMPFVSYGGSSLLTSYLSMMILLIISNQPDQEPVSLPNPKSYALASTCLAIAIGIILIVDGWWAYIRSPQLVSRADNPRAYIADLYSPRGNLVDRKNKPILTTVGKSGSYTRSLSQIPLGAIVGYSHPLYGQAGLESGLDAYLRSAEGTPTSIVWLNQILYAQRPAGLDVRLSIDLTLQKEADSLLGEKTGAIVLLNADTGEILVMASHPYYDPGKIDTEWQNWIQDTNSRLLNRATQGQYPPGATLGAFLMAWNYKSGATIPDLPAKLSTAFHGSDWDCSLAPKSTIEWPSAIQNGCPAALLTLGKSLTVEDLQSLYSQLGFGTTPSLPLEVAPALEIKNFSSHDQETLGQGEVSVSPLQMALAAASISTGGTRPAPVIATAIDTPQQGWVALSTQPTASVFTESSLTRTAHQLAVDNQPIWQVVANAHAGESVLSWYVGGSLPEWQGTPLALAVILEDGNAAEVQEIGQKLLLGTIQPNQ
jgi:cell division protein FtsW (lipid II flippase)